MAAAARPFWRTLVRHLAIGIPLSALLHTILQTAADRTSFSIGITILHFVLGMLLGSIVLGPAYALQAIVSRTLTALGVGRVGLMVSGGVLQALLVALWASWVGIEPSLPGRFALTLPMIAAGFFAGAVVGALAGVRASGPAPKGRAAKPPRP